MSKYTGWLWAAGAGVVGLGAWLALSKKASAQESVIEPTSPMSEPPPLPSQPDDFSTIDYDWRTYVVDGPVLTVAEADTVEAWRTQGTNASEWKAALTMKARECLPMGEFVSVERVKKGVDAVVFRATFRFLGEPDMSAVQSCMMR